MKQAGPAGGSAPQLPHDIRGLVEVPTPWWTYAGGALALLALVVGCAWLYRLWQRRRRAAPEQTITSDPWLSLVGRLEAFKVPSTFAPGRSQEDYYYGLSLLLREVIERRTAVAATDLTLQELREPLRRKLPLATAEVGIVLEFLERADLVKFAGRPSDRAEAERWHLAVLGWTRALAPRAREGAAPWQQGERVTP